MKAFLFVMMAVITLGLATVRAYAACESTSSAGITSAPKAGEADKAAADALKGGGSTSQAADGKK